MTGAPGAGHEGLHARLRVSRGAHVVDVTLRADPGEVVAVVGPNGSGKTTVLRALAGLLPLEAGEVRCAGRTWESPSTRLEVRHRRVGMVFQERLLFPRHSTRDNVAFGPRARGSSRPASRQVAQRWLDRLGIGELADRRPHQLSGGQAQRVALARALATEPQLLLLDEPLAALDVAVATMLRIELARHLAAYQGVTVLVTHDALDALALADQLVVLDDGAVVQQGTPSEVARAPRTAHVARLVGLNLLTGDSQGTHVALAEGSELVTSTPYQGRVQLVFSPVAVTLSVEAPTGSARNVWRGRVVSLAPHGLAVRVHLDVAGGLLADVTAESAARLGLAPGREVWAAVKATEIDVRGEPDRGAARLL